MNKTDWFHDRKWGCFFHYLYGKAGYNAESKFQPEVSWNECVNTFDAEAFAKQMDELRAGYVFITLMQGKKYMCAPNDTYNKITGEKPGEACSERDLIMDLADELEKYDIPLMVYFTGDGPWLDEKCGPAMGYHDRFNEVVTEEFVKKWTSVLKEYAVRYGDKVKGWWIDGCCNFFGYNEDLLKYYKEAVTAGNENALLALNNGVYWIDLDNPEFEPLFEGETHPYKKNDIACRKYQEGNEMAMRAIPRPGPKRYSKYEDFTAGEEMDFIFYPEERFTDGAQWHILSFLGQNTAGGGRFSSYGWGNYGSKYSGKEMREYVDKVNAKGGVVTIEAACFRDGSMDAAQVEVLKYLKSCRD